MRKIFLIFVSFFLVVCCFSVNVFARKERCIKIVHVEYPAHHYWDWYSDPIYWYCDPFDGDRSYSYANYVDYKNQKNKNKTALDEIDLIEKRKSQSEKGKKELTKVKVVEAKFYKQYTTDSPAISPAEIILKNNANYAIAAVFFRGQLITAKTGKVMIDGDFKCDLPEVLKPGDTNAYEVPLNDFAGWAKVNVSDTTKFDVSIIGLCSSDGTIYATTFSSKDQMKLDSLKKKCKIF